MEEHTFSSVSEKLSVFSAAEKLIVSFVTADITIVIITAFFLFATPWIEIVLRELVEVIVVVAICWLFRLRYIRIEREDDVESYEEEYEDSSYRSRKFKRVEAVPLKQMNRDPLIVVQNPPTIIDGSILPSISFATSGEPSESSPLYSEFRTE